MSHLGTDRVAHPDLVKQLADDLAKSRAESKVLRDALHEIVRNTNDGQSMATAAAALGITLDPTEG